LDLFTDRRILTGDGPALKLAGKSSGERAERMKPELYKRPA
jgi:hypothetical protein